MIYNPDKHHRRSIRLNGYDYSQAGAYFITICTRNRNNLFGKIENLEMILNDAGQIVSDSWIDLPNHYQNIVLDIFVIMPNHFHAIIVFTGPVGAIHESPFHESPLHESPIHDPHHNEKRAIRESPLQRRTMGLSKTIGRFKMVSSKKINLLRKTPGAPVWQRNYYEHIIRDEKSYRQISEYVRNNPLTWQDDRYYENPYRAR